MKYLSIYLLLSNIIAGYVFWSDKKKAIKKENRISEKMLHLFELSGGVFSILVLMYKIRHKNQKGSYYLLTYGIAILWTLIVGYLVYNNFIE